MASEELARLIGHAWEKLPEPRHPFSLEIIIPDRPSMFVNLPENIELVHDFWLRLSEKFGVSLHHRDIVGVALRRMNRELRSGAQPDVLADVMEELRQRPADLPQQEERQAQGIQSKKGT